MKTDGRRVPLWSLVLLVLTLLLAADATSASTNRVVFLTHTASRELRRSDPNDESSSTGLERRDAQLEGGRIGLRPSRPGKKPEYVAHPASDLVCRPFGECEPCPENELDQPFCLPFGNRRLLHCLPASDAAGLDENGQKDGREPSGEVPAWEGCGKVIRKERQNFWEFVTANILFLIVAGAILWGRTSALASAQYRQLAARIGIPSTTAGWRG